MKKWLLMLGFFVGLSPVVAMATWNADWTNQKKITINAQGVTPAVANFPVVVRLHSGNFDFTSTNIDGSDIRFVAADDKTELKFHIEKFDAVNELAVIWVMLPNIDAAQKDAHFFIYSGNEKATASGNAKASFDANTVANFHFIENAMLQDSLQPGLVATGEVAPQKSALIGDAVTLNGTPLTIQPQKISATTGFTWSAWIKPAAIPQQSTILNVADSVTLKITDATLTLSVDGTAVTGGELKSAAWQSVAFSLSGTKATLYLNGVAVATAEVPAVELESEQKIGEGFTGDLDELVISNIARADNYLKLIATAQGMDSQLLKVEQAEAGEEGEGEGEANYIGILVNSLTLDAKIVIGILAVMFAISVWVMWSKFSLVTRTDKDNKKFLKRFQESKPDELLKLDQGGNYKHSNLFMLYMAGLREIKKRVHDGKLSLSGASMDAIKASVDAELVRETQRQNAGIVLLTIAISGGPFLGLLGTVVGVMITFAAIAAAGDVNVNAIAPGIAAALLATVAGLGVAIPALFAYNYLASRIKNITIAMQIFVDEFITRSAELYGKE